MPKPQKDLKMVKKVKQLKDENGLSFRQVATLLKKDVKTVYRWYTYDVGKLSTD